VMKKIKLRRDVSFIPAIDKLYVISNEERFSVADRKSINLLGHLAGLISRATPKDEILQRFSANDRDAVTTIIDVLCQRGLIINDHHGHGEDTSKRADRISQPNVTFIGHATLLIKTNDFNILTDPWIFAHDNSIQQLPHPITFDELPDLDLICISHSHSDHMHLPTLFRLDKQIPVIVPLIESPNEYNFSLKDLLYRFGFERVTCLRTWEDFKLNDLSVTRTPCHKAWTVTEQATWLIESPEISIFCGGDMMEDEQVMKAIGKNYNLDLAFLPISGYSQRIGGLAFKELFPVETHNLILRDAMGVNQAVQATQWMRPRFAVGYANGGAYWYHRPEESITDEGGSEFVKILEQRNPQVIGIDMKPGDTWEHKSERLLPFVGSIPGGLPDSSRTTPRKPRR